MSSAVTPEPLDLAALLCSRVCHDLISPSSAIVNGLEVYDDAQDEETKTFALDLVRKSAGTVSARLQFSRLAFGAAGSAGAQIDLGDAEKVARGALEDEKVKINWGLPRLLLPKNRVKLLLNLMLLSGHAIPRGGVLTVDPIGEGETMGFRIEANGLNARVPEAMVKLLDEVREGDSPIDAHAIQPYFTGLLARHCGLRITVGAEGELIVFRTHESAA
ncbi:MAG: histidine phosphotransferase family protein [Xanthobacteraceae bacterium]